MTQLKVVSWNIFGGRDVPGVIKGLRELDADIIGLQEVLESEDGGENNAREIAEALGYSWLYAPTQLLVPSSSYVLTQLGIGEKKWWGNALLSRYPMSDKQVHTLSETSKRTALEATVTVDGARLRVLSTHLVHGGERAAEVRNAQVERLVAAISSDVPAIVMGDFNATPESASVKRVGSVLVQTERDLTRPTIGLHPELYHGPGGATDRLRLDYIFATSDLSVIETGTFDSDASDHIPVYAILNVP